METTIVGFRCPTRMTRPNIDPAARCSPQAKYEDPGRAERLLPRHSGIGGLAVKSVCEPVRSRCRSENFRWFFIAEKYHCIMPVVPGASGEGIRHSGKPTHA